MFPKLLAHNPLHGSPPEISGWLIVKFFIFSLALVIISDVPSTWGGMYYGAQGLLGLLLFAVIFLPFRPALVLLLLLVIAGKDIVSSLDDYSTASIWQLQFGPIRPSWIVFVCMLAKLVQAEVLCVTASVKRVILWFATVPVVTGLLYGGFFAEYAMTEVVIDIKFPLMLLASIVLYQTVYRGDRRYFGLILSAFVGGLLARHLMDLILFTANFGPAIVEGLSRGSLDSAKGGVVFLVFFGVCLLLVQKRLLLGISVAIPSVLLLVAYSTRMLWITFILGAIVLFFLSRLRRSVFSIAIMIILTLAGSWALFMVNPDSAELSFARSKMITEGRSLDKFALDVDYNIVSRIDPIRYAQILNIGHSSYKRYSFLWGTGYGGYYEDDVIGFPRDLMSSFPQYSLDTGKFYRAHFYPLQIFLKHGLFGLFCISALWLVPGYSLFKIFKNKNMFAANQSFWLHIVMLSFVAFLPTAILCLYWSGKGLFINGVIIASCIEFSRRGSNAHILHGCPQKAPS